LDEIKIHKTLLVSILLIIFGRILVTKFLQKCYLLLLSANSNTLKVGEPPWLSGKVVK
jgi:hypothetical protein